MKKEETRREMLKKLVYVSPIILTLPALPAFAGKGSSSSKKRVNTWPDRIEKGPRP